MLLLLVDGRASREGNRIAKELLESMTGQETEVDDDMSCSLPFSSQMLTASEGVIDDEDDGDLSIQLPVDPLDDSKGDDENNSSIKPNGMEDTKPDESIETHKKTNDSNATEDDLTKKSMVQSVQESSTDTDSPLGFPRHRPPRHGKQNNKTTKDQIELNDHSNPLQENRKQVVETAFTVDSEDSLMASVANNTLSASSPSHSPTMSLPNRSKEKSQVTTNAPLKHSQQQQQQRQRSDSDSPVLQYPNSPGALKNLNILSRSSSLSGRARKTSTGSRASSSVSIIHFTIIIYIQNS